MRGRRGTAHREKSDAAPPRLRSRSGSDACSGVGSGAAWKSSTSKSSNLQPSSERSAKRGRDIAGRRGGSGGEAAPQHHLAAPSLGRVSAPQLLQTTRALDRVQRVLLRHTPRRRGREHAQRRAAAQRCLFARRGGAPAGCPSGTGPLARAAAERALRRARNLQPRRARGGEEHLPGGRGVRAPHRRRDQLEGLPRRARRRGGCAPRCCSRRCSGSVEEGACLDLAREPDVGRLRGWGWAGGWGGGG